jgi:inward rectifier potassium channel
MTSTKLRTQRIRKKPVSIMVANTEVTKLGTAAFDWKDLYHLTLRLSWPRFLIAISILYWMVNIFFGLLYWLDPNGIENARPGSFADAFFFSVQTLATVGYGRFNPDSLYANILSSVEIFVGLLGLSMMTGLLFARFSVPRARVLFSDLVTVSTYEKQRTLMFRVANQRHNYILQAAVRVTVLRDQVSAEGERFRRFHDLHLVRNSTPILALSWTVMHIIDQSSPLYGLDNYDLGDLVIIVSLIGTDETFSQPIQARKEYAAEDIRWGYRFVDIMRNTESGRRIIDYRHFHDVQPAA